MTTRIKTLPDLRSSRDNGKIVGIMSSNVEDPLYGSLAGYERAMDEILKTFFNLGKECCSIQVQWQRVGAARSSTGMGCQTSTTRFGIQSVGAQERRM